MKFSDSLHQDIEPVWQRCYEHPFLREMANGTLPLDKFKFYLLQDTKYLNAFTALHKFLASKMPTPAMAAPLLATIEESTSETAERTETNRQLQITPELLAKTTLAPVATAYVNHMYHQAYFVSAAAGVASLLPCYWSYAECFKKMQAAGTQTLPVYQASIDYYAGQAFQKDTVAMIKLLDELAGNASAKTLEQMRLAFNLSSDYELMYWQMSYDRQQWPHQRFTTI
ncbi:thiaminase II [Limosilactobacillus sp.]|uniref:thiaminase II n=1 Tax=Limosilactobacillus sp. TaxID=2773925 RepID=UPI003F11B4CD